MVHGGREIARLDRALGDAMLFVRGLGFRPTFDRTPLVKITKPKLLDLRSSLKEREEPIGNATINTLFASLSAAYSYFIEQGWCSENPLKFVRHR